MFAAAARPPVVRSSAVRPVRALADRYLLVPCEAEGCGDLSILWDRLEEQVVDVVDARAARRYADEDALWDEARPFAASDTGAGSDSWRLAA